MKAVFCESFGAIENLVIEETPSFKPNKGEVIIDVKACGLNFPDTLIFKENISLNLTCLSLRVEKYLVQLKK